MATLDRHTRFARLVAIGLLSIAWTCGAEPAKTRDEFITLGTLGGPMSNAERSQPANALVVGEAVYLVDAGDGALGQLAKAGIPVTRVRAVFISHLHFDHTGGLFAVLGLRTQIHAAGKLTVYGPPGTRHLVEGIVEAMQPAFDSAYGIPGQTWTPSIEARELVDGSSVRVGDMKVTAARNTHYSFPEGSDEYERFQSLSLRFDLPDRSIVYTGDTAPSANVEKLAAGADLLVSEIIDVPAVLELIRAGPRSDADKQLAALHLSTQHLRPCEVGELASRAGVTQVVITHFVPAPADADMLGRFRGGVEKCFDGRVQLANDLDHF